ncbi:hypothetical protein V1511DRAFT_496161 [Dipodascopsis uninucleata]
MKSLGLAVTIPLYKAALYDRHIMLGGSDLGILHEQVMGLTGLWKGPSDEDRTNQAKGAPLDASKWDETFWRRLEGVPSWSEYSLKQLSSDGFEIKKRTKSGYNSVKVAAGSRATGVAYLGSAHHGGLAAGMCDFWERYPTQIDLNDLVNEDGEMVMWMYAPSAEPMETSPYRDKTGLETYEKQSEGVLTTYEDYEEGFSSAEGIARTNQFVLEPFHGSKSISKANLAGFIQEVRSPPRILVDLTYMHSTGVFGGYWVPSYKITDWEPSSIEISIEKNLEFLFNFYLKQIEQNRWYGFWDYGDIQHTYDPYRHEWRYDVGGFAWDNSELSTDLWLWLYFLHTGRADVFKMAEAMTRHTGEVDVYHSGRFKGFGTRHGVLHYADSSKQVRVSNVLYRRIYYYLTGDERVGDLMEELEISQNAILTLDSHRKVQAKDPKMIPSGFAMTNIGLDCGALAAAWLTGWERRTQHWETCKELLIRMTNGIASLKHGLATNSILLNVKTGEIQEVSPPTPEYNISHLSMLFGFPEAFSESIDAIADVDKLTADKFRLEYFKYGKAYTGDKAIQIKEFGFEFPADRTSWKQSHSTLTADIAAYEESKDIALAAWNQFFHTDGLNSDIDWEAKNIYPPECFVEGEEAAWLSTNHAARYGVSAIHNLGRIRQFLKFL